MNMNKVGTFIVSLWVASSPTSAMKFIPSNSSTYYKIGGGSDLLVPAVQSVKRIKLGANINARLFPSCSGFNPSVSIKNSLNNIKNNFVGVPTELVAGTTAAIQGYSLAKIQQTMPGMFDSMVNHTTYAGTEFKLKRKPCEQIQRQVSNGGSPIDGLFELSDSEGWVDATKRAAQGKDVDVVSEEKKITQNRENYGVPWVHRAETYSGGKNQKPIKVITDVVIAGYNLIANDTGPVVLDSLEAPSPDSNANFVRFWPNPKVAADWATKVVGDISFTKDETKKNTENGDVVAGIGLSAMLQTCPEIGNNAYTCPQAVSELIWQMINGDETIDASNLERLNSGGMAVSFEVMDTIKNMDKGDQIVAVSKLSHDIAMQNLIEEALALRRILLAGFQIQEVQNLKPVRTTVKNTIEVLDKEIESLAFENKIRRELSNKTLSTILDIRDEAMAKANAMGTNNTEHVANGALYTEKGDQS